MTVKNFVATAMLFTALVVWGGSALADDHAYRLRVDGLACPFCAYGIEKKLSSLKGVGKLAFDMEAGVVTVTMADGAVLDEAVARRAVKEAGFTLRGFERDTGR
jgi:mercuric ion binding protein